MWKRYFLLLALIAAPIFALPGTSHAVDVFNRDTCKRFEGKSVDETPTVCRDKELSGANPLTGSGGIITSIANTLTIIVAIVAVIMIIVAGLKLITSGANPQDVNTAREQIIYALVALIIAAIAQVLVRFVITKI